MSNHFIKSFNRIKFLCIIVILSSGCFQSCKTKKSSPNVLLILTDDQGWGDLSINENPSLKTPNLDQLSKTGISFDRYYVSPLCAPTRASLLTGKYHPRTGTIGVTGGLERMNASEYTLAEIFKDNGYATGAFGKWHNGEHYPENPIGQGFQEFIGFCAGHWNNYFDTEIQEYFEMVRFEGYLPDFLTDSAIKFIKQNKDQPFFCYVPLNTPHTPHQVPDAYFDKFKKEGLSDELAAIYGMVENIDDNVGRLIKTLKDEKLMENTIVIFMSDNGPNGIRFNGGMKGKKGMVDEGGVRSPLFIKYQNRWKEPKIIKQLAAHIDIYPTLIKLCELKTDKELNQDGIDLTEYIDGSKTTIDREIYSLVTYDKSMPKYPGAVRTENFRWVIQKDSFHLYDMQNDPLQKVDLIDSLPEIHRIFNKKYNDWFKSVSKELDVSDRTSIPIGYTKVKKLEIQAPQAAFSGNIHFFEGHGWANDWLTNWTPADSITWNLVSKSEQKYAVHLKYTCTPEEVGSVVTLTLNGKTLKGIINEPFDPQYIPSPDRVPRKEAYEKPWKRLKLGEIVIPKGQSSIVLNASNSENTEVGHIKGLSLVLIP